jgi:hypothetical protein
LHRFWKRLFVIFYVGIDDGFAIGNEIVLEEFSNRRSRLFEGTMLILDQDLSESDRDTFLLLELK